MYHLGQFLAGKRADAPQEALQILDIVLRELSSKRYNFSWSLHFILNFVACIFVILESSFINSRSFFCQGIALSEDPSFHLI